jgi:hypothetical protein
MLSSKGCNSASTKSRLVPVSTHQSERASINFRSLLMPTKLSKPRFNAFLNQSGRCYYCESPIWLNDKEGFAIKYSISVSAAEELRCTAEHLVARVDGGGNNPGNIVAACVFCNKTRHRIKCPPSPSQYKKHVKRRLNKGKWHKKSLLHLATHSM